MRLLNTGRAVRLVAVVAALAVVASACGGDDDDEAAVPEPDGTETFEVIQGHTTEDVDYAQSPPVGGIHDAEWQNCGVYTEPLRDENAVHSMEHGAVWITYSEDLDEASIATLEAKADGESHVLVSPYPGLTSPVVLNAWGKQLAVDSADDPRVDQFLEAFVEGPQTAEPGATCSGAKSEA